MLTQFLCQVQTLAGRIIWVHPLLDLAYDLNSLLFQAYWISIENYHCKLLHPALFLLSLLIQVFFIRVWNIDINIKENQSSIKGHDNHSHCMEGVGRILLYKYDIIDGPKAWKPKCTHTYRCGCRHIFLNGNNFSCK